MSAARLAWVLVRMVVAAGCHPSPPSDPAATIEYQGERIRLSKPFDDFDKYKNDPSNIAPEEIPRVQALVRAAKVPDRCADLREVISATMAVEFPGYGLSGLGGQLADGRSLVADAIEIPHGSADRYVVYISDGTGYRLVDDTVLPEKPYVTDVTVREGNVVYLSKEGAVIVQRPTRPLR
jgi:hypothetical protein